MPRAPFTGPVRSSAGYEVGEGDDIKEVIDEEGNFYGSLGDEDDPGYFYGWASGAFAGNVAIATSTVTAANLPAVAEGTFSLFYTSTGGLILKTSTGIIGTVTVAT